jgi:hypothetical protein
MDTLAFVARRLEADGIALIFAAREGEADGVVAPGTAVLQVRGLAPDDAAVLLTQTAPGLAEPVARRLVEACGGNPLALLEIPAHLTVAQRRGDQPLPEPFPVGLDVEQTFAAQAARLPEETRTLLTLAAAEDTGRIELIGRAAETLPVDLGSLSPAEEAGLIKITAGRVEFRSGPGPAAVALQRAAALSPDPQERGRRLVSAAEASWTAGRPVQALELLDNAEPLLADRTMRSGLLGLRGLIELSSGLPESASNPEIASQLFLSRKTVEYRLHKVFTKLGIAVGSNWSSWTSAEVISARG